MSDSPKIPWPSVRLGDLVRIEYGRALAAEARTGSGGTAVMGSSGELGLHDTPLVEEPVIVVGRKGNAGAAYLTTQPSWPIDTTYYFAPPPEVDARFLRHQLDWLDLGQRDSSTTIPSLRRPDLESVRLATPPLEEQQRIVDAIEAHLSRLDAAVHSLEAVGRRLGPSEAALLRAAVEGGLVPQDPSEGTGRELLAAITAGQRQAESTRRRSTATVSLPPPSPIGEYRVPSPWALCRADVLGEVQLGRQRSPKNHTGRHMRPYLRAANVTWAGLDLTDLKEMNFSPDEQVRFQLRPGDILLNEASGSADEVGKPAIWDARLSGVCFQNTLLRVTSVKSVSLLYLHLVFLEAARTGRFAKVARGVNIMHLGRASLAAWPVPLPPRAEQDRIVEAVERQTSTLRALAHALGDARRRSAALRQSILAAAFSGRLVPTDSAAAVASEVGA